MSHEPLPADELPLRTIHVNVRLIGPGWQVEWRQVKARDLQGAITAARAMPDVRHVYEASFIPGGVVT